MTTPYRWVCRGLILLGATTGVEPVLAWGDLMSGLVTGTTAEVGLDYWEVGLTGAAR